MLKRLDAISALLFLLVAVSPAMAADAVLTIDASAPTRKVSPMLYGLMTEEINHCYDGGLYAELVQNRAFLDDTDKPVHWSILQGNGSAGRMALDRDHPLNDKLTTSLRLDVASASTSATVGVANDGYWGIPVKPGTRYHASFFAKAAAKDSGPVTVSIVDKTGAKVFATGSVPGLTMDWQEYQVDLSTADATTTADSRLVISVDRPGTFWFDLVSLFPPTWKNRPNGLRLDLMQMLVDLKPAFLRFPGGNYLEGDTIETRFDWKKTLGPLSGRQGHAGPWGYRSTDGLGFLEFLEWCQDMNAEPVLAVYAGYSLKGQFVKPGDDLKPYIQDALDEIEYVTGSAQTKWGAQRVADGHSDPFKLRYVEIGNEDWFDKSGSYEARFAQFVDAIKGRYPNLKCISTVGNEQPAAKRVHRVTPDVLDEHYYRSVAAFSKDSPTHFDKYDRNGPEIFVGEWASFEDIEPWKIESKSLPPTPSMKAALGDAAFMAAMERNSDLVKMHCYAPMLVNVNSGANQWRPNLIGYDALNAFGSPSYYAIRMFSTNIGDQIVNATLSQGPIQYSVTRDSQSGTVYLKLINLQPEPQAVKIDFIGVVSLAPTAAVSTLSADPKETNSIDAPTKVIPVDAHVDGVKSGFTFQTAANSVTVLKFDAR